MRAVERRDFTCIQLLLRGFDLSSMLGPKPRGTALAVCEDLLNPDGGPLPIDAD
jgi:hypothetical protein